jgi:hypothetical protein
MNHEQSAKAALVDLRRAPILVGAGTDPAGPDSPIPDSCGRLAGGGSSANVGNGEEAGTAPGAGLVIQDTDAPGAVPSPVVSGATGGEPPHLTARRMHVEGYPVPNRSALYNRRVAGHEIGHAFLARALGSNVHSVTIVPGHGYEGRCMRSGPPSQLNLDENPEAEMQEVVDICSRLEKLTPEIGSGRVESAEFYVRAQINCTELVGGRACELLLYPDLPPLPAEHDHIEARAFAAVACAAPPAVNALLAYAEAEASALLEANLPVVLALVEAIIERGTLTGDEVDEVIETAVACETLRIEHDRRAEWARVQHSASAFAARGLES